MYSLLLWPCLPWIESKNVQKYQGSRGSVDIGNRGSIFYAPNGVSLGGISIIIWIAVEHTKRYFTCCLSPRQTIHIDIHLQQCRSYKLSQRSSVVCCLICEILQWNIWEARMLRYISHAFEHATLYSWESFTASDALLYPFLGYAHNNLNRTSL